MNKEKEYELIKADMNGRVVETLPNGELDTLQKAVGGYIEPIRLSDKMTMWVNEEGMLQNLPVNMAASLMVGHTILGDVVIETTK
jgi:hypothetical protein